MAETGCLKDGHFQNLEVGGKLEYDPVNRYLDYSTYNRCNLTATGIEVTQDEGQDAVTATHTTIPTPAAITAVTLIATAVNTFAGDGSGPTEVYLPPAVAGTHVCLEITGDIDQNGAISMRCAPAGASTAGLDRFAGLHTVVVDILWKTTACIPTGATAYAKTAGTVLVPTATELIYTATSANNWLGVLSEIHFYCPKAGQWIAKIMAITDGTGEAGVLSFGTTSLV